MANEMTEETQSPIEEQLETTLIKSTQDLKISPAAKSPIASPGNSWASLLRSSESAKKSQNAPMSNGAVHQQPSETSATKLPTANDQNMMEYLPIFDPVRIQPRGLLNTGNLCFLNSILQPLVYCPPFYHFFRIYGPRIAMSSLKLPLLTAMISFLNEFELVTQDKEEFPLPLEDSPPIAPEYVFDALFHTKKFDTKKGRQEDAEEFLGFLLDGLEEELLSLESKKASETENASEDWIEIGRKNKAVLTRQTVRRNSPVARIFGGTMRSVVKSPGAKESITIQPFQSLQLDISDAVYAITEPEFLDGFSVDSHSRRRSSQDTPIDHLNTASFTLSTTTKQSLFETMPPVLILHLKRFVYDPQSNSISKLQKYLEYDTSLDLDSQKLFSSVGKRQLGHCTYKLFAVIYHHGRSVAGGHYTADVCLNPNFKSQPTDSQSTQERNGEGEEQPIWVQMDDALMQKVSVADVLAPKKDREAYLLFYARET